MNTCRCAAVYAAVVGWFVLACSQSPTTVERRDDRDIVVQGEVREATATNDDGLAANTTNVLPSLSPLPEQPPIVLSANETQVSRTPPANIPPLAIAPDRIEGMYYCTVDYLEPRPYWLVLFYQYNAVTKQDELNWYLMRDTTEKIVGYGTWVERDGGVEVTEFRREEGQEMPHAVELFPAERAPNRWTVHQAFDGQGGETAFGAAMRALGPEVHWVRGSMCDHTGQILTTSAIYGIFNPIVDASVTADRRKADRAQRFAVWHDGTWRLARYPDGPGTQPQVFGGTWRRIADGSNRFVFTQTISPLTSRVTEPPQEEFEVVFDSQRLLLWMVKRQSDPRQLTAVLPSQPGVEECVVYTAINATAR